MDDALDLEALDAYLMSESSPEGCMMLSDMDGFLHGLACGPVSVPSAEWLPDYAVLALQGLAGR